jgi:hypothetical protein
MVALLPLYPILEICAFCAPTSFPSCSCVRLRYSCAACIILPNSARRSSSSQSSYILVPAIPM